MFDHDFPDATFIAVRSDGLSRKNKVIDFVDERVGAAAVDVFAVPSAVFVDEDAEDFSGLGEDGLLDLGK